MEACERLYEILRQDYNESLPGKKGEIRTIKKVSKRECEVLSMFV